MMRQGPHHTAQKSMRTGMADCSTSCAKLASVISTGFIGFSSRFLIWLAFGRYPDIRCTKDASEFKQQLLRHLNPQAPADEVPGLSVAIRNIKKTGRIS